MSRKRECKAVLEYLTALADDDLRLWGWRIKVPLEPTSEPENFAETEVIEGRRLANIHVCNGFASQDPEEIHEVLIHELLHLVEAGVAENIRSVGSQAGMSTSAYDAFAECVRLQRELMVDHLAAVFAEKIPIKKKLMKAITEQGNKKG